MLCKNTELEMISQTKIKDLQELWPHYGEIVVLEGTFPVPRQLTVFRDL